MILNFTQTFTFLVLKWEGSSGSLKIGTIISPTPKVQILTTSNLDKYYVFFFLSSDRSTGPNFLKRNLVAFFLSKRNF